MDCRAQRRRTIWYVRGLQLPQDETGRRTASDRGSDRSERRAFWTIDALESAGVPRAARSIAGDSNRAGAVICGTDLLAGGAESDAGVAFGRARAAGSAGIRTHLRVGDGGSVWRGRVVP